MNNEAFNAAKAPPKGRHAGFKPKALDFGREFANLLRPRPSPFINPASEASTPSSPKSEKPKAKPKCLVDASPPSNPWKKEPKKAKTPPPPVNPWKATVTTASKSKQPKSDKSTTSSLTPSTSTYSSATCNTRRNPPLSIVESARDDASFELSSLTPIIINKLAELLKLSDNTPVLIAIAIISDS
ncbi:uncharacterized protein RSE6_14987 [Rhynchosporium secalis]|uniref:Uncharacterized protein n=1 Tax=Rhynchosporium secalis TaxID=38038 RepID=A0A1E1MWJ2_RHYSE|nr:uncharacterized protein RSE6_14987 [Rhynchosporium secalis]